MGCDNGTHRIVGRLTSCARLGHSRRRLHTRNATVLALALLAGCSRCSRQPPPPQPRGTLSLVPAAPSEHVQGWALVTGGEDQAPFLTDANPRHVTAYLARGQLVERRTETRPDFVPKGPLRVERAGPESPIREEGSLTAIQKTAFDLGFAFEQDLGTAPEGLPPRPVICEAAAAQSPPVLTHDACDRTGHLLWIAAARRLVLWAASSPDESILLLIDPRAAADRPAVASSLRLGLVQRVRLLPLPGGDTALVVEERLPGTARTGIRVALVLATAAGKLERRGELERSVTEQRGSLVSNSNGAAFIDRSASTVVVRGEELVQDPVTGEIRSRAPVLRRAGWDATTRQLRVER